MAAVVKLEKDEPCVLPVEINRIWRKHTNYTVVSVDNYTVGQRG